MQKITRRDFILVTTLATGFALCTHPLSAEVITTDAQNLVVGEVQIPVTDGTIPAYQARPATGNNFPVILVIQEIFGVHEHLKDICRRFAHLGYLAIAPELYARQGDVSQMTNIQEIISKVVSQVPDAQVMSDLDATVTWVASNGMGNINKMAITGFCWGGRIVWLYAAHNPKLKAGVAWYGRLVGESTPLTPQHPIDIAPNLTVPILGLYGGDDSFIPVSTVTQMRQALAQGNSNSEIIVYPDTPHGFYADYRPSYRQEAAKDAWQRLQGWLNKY